MATATKHLGNLSLDPGSSSGLKGQQHPYWPAAKVSKVLEDELHVVPLGEQPLNGHQMALRVLRRSPRDPLARLPASPRCTEKEKADRPLQGAQTTWPRKGHRGGGGGCVDTGAVGLREG